MVIAVIYAVTATIGATTNLILESLTCDYLKLIYHDSTNDGEACYNAGARLAEDKDRS